MNRRLLSVLGLLFVVGCAGVTDTDEESTSSSLASDEAAYVGDQGPEFYIADDEARFDPPSSVISVAAPDRRVLGYVWQGQQTGYWCGPGSTRIALSTRLSGLPSQQTLANYEHTTTQGTARINVVAALNNWIPGNGYRSIAIGDPATAQERQLVKATVVNRIAAGLPVVANVLSGWRPPGYPTGTIGHFVAVVGYEAGGERVLIADPAGEGAAGPRWRNVPRAYWISLQNFATWVGARGLAG